MGAGVRKRGHGGGFYSRVEAVGAGEDAALEARWGSRAFRAGEVEAWRTWGGVAADWLLHWSWVGGGTTGSRVAAQRGLRLGKHAH